MSDSDLFGYDLEKGIHELAAASKCTRYALSEELLIMHSGTVSALVDANLLYQQQKKLRLPRRSQVNSLIPSFAQFSFFELPPSMQ